MDILNQFGIQPVLLLAQIVNFLILLFILKRFLYVPILKMLETRKAAIAKSLKDAEEIEQKLAQTEEDRKKELAKALKEASEIIEGAKKSASQIVNEAHLKAQSDIGAMIKRGQQDIQSDREKMRTEIREEVSRLVVAGLKVVTGKVLSQKDQAEILKKSIKEL